MATCQELRDQLAVLKNDEILLKAAVDVKWAAYQVAMVQWQAANTNLQANVQQQYVITGQMNAQGCQP